jgi:hypothetical protein
MFSLMEETSPLPFIPLCFFYIAVKEYFFPSYLTVFQLFFLDFQIFYFLTRSKFTGNTTSVSLTVAVFAVCHIQI